MWWARPGDASAGLYSLLDSHEQNRARGFHRSIDRDQFVVGCGLVRLALAAYLLEPPALIALVRTCFHCGQPHGKPRLAMSVACPVEFSVSHAGDRVVVAFALQSPIGVDVESVDASLGIEGLVPATLTACEAESLERLPTAERVRGFLSYWTRKEAVVKATGLGFTVPPTSFSVTGLGEPPRLTTWPEDPELPQRVSLRDLDAGPGSIASLAVIGPCYQILAFDGSVLLQQWSDGAR